MKNKENTLISLEDIKVEVNSFISKKERLTHDDVIDLILENSEEISFKKILEISDEDEKRMVSHKEYVVISIDTLISTTGKLGVGISLKNGTFYLYNGEYWKPYNEEKLKNFLGEFAKKIGVNKYDSQYYKFKDELFKQLTSSSLLVDTKTNSDKVLINLQNGTFEITPNKQVLREFRKNDFITYQLPFSYTPEAKYPLFQKYIKEVLPDVSVEKVLSEYLGYVFINTSYLKLEKVAFLYGDGANGKSVMFEIINALLSTANVSNYSLERLTEPNGYYRAKIVDKLVNYSSEISSKVGGTEVFKSLASGEPVDARSPYKEPFIANNYAKLIFNANNLPQDSEQTEGYFRRFLIIPFYVTIPKENQDKELSKKIIESELPGVFNWILDGLKRVLSQKGFSDSDKINKIENKFRSESDSVQMFLEDGRYSISEVDTLPLKSIYMRYKFFCNDDGYKPVGNKNFKKRMEKLKYKFKKESFGIKAFITSKIPSNRIP